jgi:hypothetical protein
MWFYLYLLTTFFYEKMGFHMWGYTTNTNFSYNIVDRYSSYYNNTIYYSGIYQIPTKFIGYPFDRIITVPFHKMVRDEFGLEWYSISQQTIKDIFSNASIPFYIISIDSWEEEHDEL